MINSSLESQQAGGTQGKREITRCWDVGLEVFELVLVGFDFYAFDCGPETKVP